MNLTDICVNLSNNQFKLDRKEVLQRAVEHDVSRFIVVGTDLASSRFCLDWAEERSDVFASAGIHPHDADEAPVAWQQEIEALAEHPKVVAIGETGLDFNRNYSSRANQIICFEAQIAIAEKLQMPLFVHDRESDGLVLEKLRAFSQPAAVVIHCFTGTESELLAYLEAGFSIGITGWICDRRRGTALREMVHRIPLDRLLVETDAPFLRPHNIPADWLDRHQLGDQYKRRCEPAHLRFVVEAIAEHRSESFSEIAKATHENANRLFKLAPHHSALRT